jgi:exosortase
MKKSPGRRRSNSRDLLRDTNSLNPPACEVEVVSARPCSPRWWWAACGVLAVISIWSYWPTLCDLVRAWATIPDYSHGFFVAPLALFFVWARRKDRPPFAPFVSLAGFALITLAFGLRWYGGRYYYDALEGWSFVLWLGGIVWLLMGRRVFMWALPSLVFLLFMVPLPYRIEIALANPLQRVATMASGWLLQFFGQVALVEGNTILLGNQRLEVSQACAGLRMFMGITALAFAYIVLVRRAWWEKAFLALAVVPIAVLANVLRITATGFLYEHVSSEWAKHLVHDGAGWITILVAAILFALVLEYLRHIMREVQEIPAHELVRSSRTK